LIKYNVGNVKTTLKANNNGKFLTFFINIKIIVLWSSKSIKFKWKCIYFYCHCFFGLSFAQNSISGTVTDSDAQSVIGANIKIVGDDAGTVTDGEGNLL
jgi:hypothetical protein